MYAKNSKGSIKLLFFLDSMIELLRASTPGLLVPLWKGIRFSWIVNRSYIKRKNSVNMPSFTSFIILTDFKFENYL